MKGFNTKYSNKEWFLMRLFFLFIWGGYIVFILTHYKSQNTPTGISKYLDLSFISIKWVSILIYAISIISAYYYLKAKNLLFTIGTMLTISIVVHTFHESQGGNQRNELVSLVLLGQFIAYIYGRFVKNKYDSNGLKEKLKNLAINNSIQLILATYFVAGISKLQTSGFYWIIDSPNIALQVYKSQMSNYTSTLFPIFKTVADIFPHYVSENPLLIQIAFSLSLVLELFGFLALYSKKYSTIVGALFLLFHLGIFLMMGVLFIPFIYFDFLFLVNLPYLFTKSS